MYKTLATLSWVFVRMNNNKMVTTSRHYPNVIWWYDVQFIRHRSSSMFFIITGLPINPRGYGKTRNTVRPCILTGFQFRKHNSLYTRHGGLFQVIRFPQNYYPEIPPEFDFENLNLLFENSRSSIAPGFTQSQFK